MVRRFQQQVRNRGKRGRMIARIQKQVSAAANTFTAYDRHRFALRFLISLSTATLGTCHSGIAQAVPLPDSPQNPGDLHHGIITRHDPMGGSAGSFANQSPRLSDGSMAWSRESTASMRVAANESQHELPTQLFDIPAGDLHAALLAFTKQSGLQLLYSSELVKGLQTQGVQGEHTAEGALHRILQDTGIQYRFAGPNTIGLQPASRSEMRPEETSDQIEPSKPVKIPEVLVKDVRERPTWTTPGDGYKADHASTVTRSTMSIDETPTSIGVVTRDLIRDTFARSQADAFEGVSGVVRSVGSMGRSEGFNIRGFFSNNVGGSFNGLKANGLPTDGLWAPDWGIVERYEIVKGPASIVGGAADPGGLVNRITKTPQRSNFTTVEANFGSYDFYRGLLDVNGIMPKHENVRGRLVFAVEEGWNFIDFTPVRQYTVAPSVEFDLFNGAGKLLLIGTYQHFDGATLVGNPLTTDGKMLNIPRTRNVGGGASNGARAQYTGYNGEIHYDHKLLHDIKLSVKGKYSQSKLMERTIFSYAYGGVPPSGDVNMFSGLSHFRYDTYAGELHLGKEFSLWGQKHELLAGADHRDMTFNRSFGYSYLPNSATPLLDNVFNPRNIFQVPSDTILNERANVFRVNLQQTGAFAQTVIRPVERLTLVFAGRHDWAESQRRNAGSTQVEQTASAWTGRAGATVKITSWLNVYGGLQQSFLPQPFGLTRDEKMLDPETGINYEAGAKMNFFEERLRFTTAIFRTYRRNVSTRDPFLGGQFVMAIGEQRHQGVELDINGQPIPGLNVNANLTFLDAEITKDNDEVLIGSRPYAVPEYVGRVFATYQVQSGPLQGFGAGGGVYFLAGNELTTPNRFTTDGYHRVDAVFFYRGNSRYDVSVNIRNLLNATYIEYPGSLHGNNMFGAPITAIGSVRVYF